MSMTDRKLFSKGFPTNRIPVTLPSTGQSIILRETTIVELKSMCKTIIDNLDRRQMDVIYDAASEYLQAMILTDDVDVNEFTDFDKLFCLMVFFQMSFFKEPIDYTCPHCGVGIVYRYDMSKYLAKMESAFVEDQQVDITHRGKIYRFSVGWPKTKTVSKLNNYFYNNLGPMTEEIESSQYGLNLVMSFIKKISIVNPYTGQVDKDCEIDIESLDNWQDMIDAINAVPSTVVLDPDNGVLSKVTGYFLNRLENCFSSEVCPQCQKITYYGLSQSSHFYSLFYGSLKSLYGFILQVECLLIYRYDTSIFADEQYMTYNDLSSLVHQIGTTAEKENDERKKVGNSHLYKGLWYIREILNNMVFPQDKKH